MYIENIDKNKILLEEIRYNKENIQVMIDMLPNVESKGEYRRIAATIKKFMSYIRDEKCQISDNTWCEKERNDPKLFDIEPSEIDHKKNMLEISSYFGALD